MTELILGDCLSVLPTLPEQSVDLVFGSPPYCDARTYEDDTLPADSTMSRQCSDWIDWMLEVSDAALRVSRGAVVWVAAGVTRGRNYQPACEGLAWQWYRQGGHAYRPCYWHRYGIPGSGGDQWFRADVEHVLCFKRAGKLPWSDNTAMGRPTKYPAGGQMSHRTRDGERRNKKPGARASYRSPVKIANPGVLISTGAAGGGNIGDSLAHRNEAPFPEALAEHFIRSLCPPGGTVLDPFCGSGTTAKVAGTTGRNAIGIDVRKSQIDLTHRRVTSDSAATRNLF